MGCGQWFNWMVRGLEGTWLNNWWQGSLADKDIWGRGMCIDLSEWEKKCEDICVPCELSPKEDFNNWVARMICSVDTSQPLSPANHIITQWAHEHNGHGGRNRGCTWTSAHQDWAGYGHRWVLNLPAAETNAEWPILHQSPGWSASHPVADWLHRTASIMEGTVHSN